MLTLSYLSFCEIYIWKRKAMTPFSLKENTPIFRFCSAALCLTVIKTWFEVQLGERDDKYCHLPNATEQEHSSMEIASRP